MLEKPDLTKFLNATFSTNSQQHLATICAEHPQVASWLNHLLAKSMTHAVLDYQENRPNLKSAALATQVASSTGRLIAAEVKLSRRWQDLIAFFRALLALTLCSHSAEMANLMAQMVPELYKRLSTKDGKILAAVVENKPVYTDVPVFDIVVPDTAQPYIRTLRKSLGDSFTPANKLTRTFNCILTHAITLILSFSWTFFDEDTLPLFPDRLLGAKILFCPADYFPNATTLLKTLKTKGKVTLPDAGSTIPAPTNSTGVTKVTLWQRDEWLVGLLTHGNSGDSIVIASPTLDGHLSLWRLLADRSTPITADPLANLTLKTYLKHLS